MATNQYRLSKRSYKNLMTCHPDLQKIVIGVLYYTDVDFMVITGGRSVAEQQSLYAQGRTKPGPIVTKVDGIRIKSKHNYEPSEAVDIAVYIKGKKEKMWDLTHLAYLTGVFTTVAKMLYESGEIEHLIRSGMNWDKDGELVSDQSFLDGPHLEIYKPQ